MAVYYIDEVMGRGKTSALINHINSAPEEDRFIYITPYLTEVDRIQKACESKAFLAPRKESGGKLTNIKRLIAERRNIVSTHALFSMFDNETIALIKDKHYTLVMDEAPAAIAPVNITPYDAACILKKGYAKILPNKCLEWTNSDYVGRFYDIRRLIEDKNIYYYNEYRWINVMPEELYRAFDTIYILTYLFENQYIRCYFDIIGLTYQRKYVAGSSPETYRLSDVYEKAPVTDFRPLIHVVDNSKLNEIGAEKTALCKSWYVRNMEDGHPSKNMDRLRKNTLNFFRNIAKTDAEDNLWTTFLPDEHGLDWKQQLSGGGYTKGFLACTARGTNAYRHKTALAYLINIYPNTTTWNFLNALGIDLDRDMYALSEMLQWIWRSAIRDGKEITLYVPSKRMRKLLTDWMDSLCKDGEEAAL